MGTMSDATQNAMKLPKHWVLDLRLGNEISPDGWAEVRAAIIGLGDVEALDLQNMVLDLLNELDHVRN